MLLLPKVGLVLRVLGLEDVTVLSPSHCDPHQCGLAGYRSASVSSVIAPVNNISFQSLSLWTAYPILVPCSRTSQAICTATHSKYAPIYILKL